MDDKFYLFRENLAHLRKWSRGSSCQDCWSGMGKKIAPVRAMDKSGYPDTKPGSGQARRHRRIFKVRVRELFPEKWWWLWGPLPLGHGVSRGKQMNVTFDANWACLDQLLEIFFQKQNRWKSWSEIVLVYQELILLYSLNILIYFILNRKIKNIAMFQKSPAIPIWTRLLSILKIE